jgi:hypothetical protein
MSEGTDGILAAINKLAAEQEAAAGIVRVQAPRDFVPCSWCGGKGCAACFNARQRRERELDEEYRRQFPDGPKPFFTARLDTPEGVESARRVVGREAVEKAFGPAGGGVAEIMENARREQGAEPKE